MKATAILEFIGVAMMFISMAMMIFEAGNARVWRPSYQQPPKKNPYRYAYRWAAVFALGVVILFILKLLSEK